MNITTLIDLAAKITPPDKQCGEAMMASLENFSNQLNTYMLKRDDLDDLIGKNNSELMISNHTNHFRYIGSLASLYDAKSLVETVIWVIRTYLNHGFKEKYWSVMLPACMETLQAGLKEDDYVKIAPIYGYLYSNFHSFLELAKETPSFYEELSGMHGLLDEDNG